MFGPRGTRWRGLKPAPRRIPALVVASAVTQNERNTGYVWLSNRRSGKRGARLPGPPLLEALAPVGAYGSPQAFEHAARRVQFAHSLGAARDAQQGAACVAHHFARQAKQAKAKLLEGRAWRNSRGRVSRLNALKTL